MHICMYIYYIYIYIYIYIFRLDIHIIFCCRQISKRETEAHLKDTSQLKTSVQDTLLQAQNFLSLDVEMYTGLLEHFLAQSQQNNDTIQACMMHARECADSIECACNEVQKWQSLS